MIKFRDNQDNPEYLMINIRVEGGILMASQILPTFAGNELERMYFDLYQFEKELSENRVVTTTHVDEVAFPKSSLLGNWLLENYDQTKIRYEDEYIYYEKVVNALSYAQFKSDPIAQKIMPLFLGVVNGSKDELLKDHDEKVLDYILKHPYYQGWLEVKEKEPVEYVVFEDGEYSKKVLSAGKKVLEKKNESETV